jgi:hypothetical protein
MLISRLLRSTLLVNISRTLFLIVLLAASGAGIACQTATLDQYYQCMLNGGSVAPQLRSARTTSVGTQQLKAYLVVDDIYAVLDRKLVDTMIMSTNVRLNLAAKNPLIQQNLKHHVDREMITAIETAFSARIAATKKESPTTRFFLPVATEGLLVDSGARELRPTRVCFIATDAAEGRTGDDEKWQVFLHRENIAKGILDCLEKSVNAGARRIAIPLVGAAQPIDCATGTNCWRELKIRRMQRSLLGIADAFSRLAEKQQKANASLDLQLLAVVYDRDVTGFMLLGKRCNEDQQREFSCSQLSKELTGAFEGRLQGWQ